MASTAAQRPLSGPFASFPELSIDQLEAVVRDGSADAAGRLLSELLDAVCVVALVSEDMERFELLSVQHAHSRAVQNVRQALAEADRQVARWPLLARVLADRRLLLIPEVKDSEEFNPAFRQYLQATGARSVLVVPLVARETAVGVVVLIRGTKQASFDERDGALAAAIAEESALNLDNIRLFETLRRRDELQSAVLGTHAASARGLGSWT